MSPPAPLAASCSLDEAASARWDVIVIGGGPSGAAISRLLADRRRVLLVDKACFPRFKVCGCFLNRSALQSLVAMGMGELPACYGAPRVTGVRIGFRGRTAALPLPPGAALSRVRFDTALIEAAVERGVCFLPETEARVAAAGDDERRVELRQGKSRLECRGRVIVVADGIGGSCLAGCPDIRFQTDQQSRIGVAAISDSIPDGYRSGTIQMAIGAGGYVGAMQTEDGRLDIAAALDRDALKGGGPGELAARICRESGLPETRGLESLTWRGTPPLTRRPTASGAKRLFLIGDAAGYVEPFTGEGMAWALLSARGAAAIVSQAVASWHPAQAAEWQRERHRFLRRRQRLCRWLTRGLRNPLFTGTMIRVLGIAPGVATPLVDWLSTAPAVRSNHVASL